MPGRALPRERQLLRRTAAVQDDTGRRVRNPWVSKPDDDKADDDVHDQWKTSESVLRECQLGNVTSWTKMEQVPGVYASM